MVTPICIGESASGIFRSTWTNRRLSAGPICAANPVEYALAALATCQEITYRLHAAALGIPLKEVSVKLEGDVDLRGFFAVEQGVRPGFQEIRGTVQFDSTAPPEDLRRLKEVVDAHCPVLDLFRNCDGRCALTSPSRATRRSPTNWLLDVVVSGGRRPATPHEPVFIQWPR